jgi:exodeoxyribonuclease-1
VPATFYWCDYETFGADPRRDRPAQFAGLRTDAELNPVAEPFVRYCRPAPDYLPDPGACLVTGITPQQALREGVPEAEFAAAVNAEFSVPETCVVGYNNIRFDDEVTRHCLYRNLYDPYAREWRNGNSRWDLIDALRLARALRPEGIAWPVDEAGRPSFRLPLLTAANGIDHADAHDAVSDVRATLALARLLRERQPRLFQFLFENRGKRQAADLLKLGAFEPVVHASEKFPADRHCVAVVVALARHPLNPNGVVAYDLAFDPTPLLTLDPEELRKRLYTPAADLPEGVERLRLKTVHTNKCPALAPMKVLRDQDAERLGIDRARCREHLELLRNAPDIAAKVSDILAATPAAAEESSDPDAMLYSGGFFSDRDRAALDRLHGLSPAELSRARPTFEDARLPELLFRYRARNFPETLGAEEAARWQAFRRRRLAEAREGYEARLGELEADPDLSAPNRRVVESLRAYLLEILA